MSPGNRLEPCPECSGPLHVLVDVTVHPFLARDGQGRLVYGGFAARPLDVIRRQLEADGVAADADLVCDACGWMGRPSALPGGAR